MRCGDPFRGRAGRWPTFNRLTPLVSEPAREGGGGGHEVRTDDARQHVQTDLDRRFNLWHGDVPTEKKKAEGLVSAA